VFDRFDLVDVARKVVGVGSVGTHCWIALLEGPNHPAGPACPPGEEAQASVLEALRRRVAPRHHGLRVVSGQRLTQASSDMFSAGARAADRAPVLRTTALGHEGPRRPDAMDVNNLAHYGSLCAWALARAHARTGDAPSRSPLPRHSDTFERAIAVFSARYAITNERDYAAARRHQERPRRGRMDA